MKNIKEIAQQIAELEKNTNITPSLKYYKIENLIKNLNHDEIFELDSEIQKIFNK